MRRRTSRGPFDQRRSCGAEMPPDMVDPKISLRAPNQAQAFSATIGVCSRGECHEGLADVAVRHHGNPPSTATPTEVRQSNRQVQLRATSTLYHRDVNRLGGAEDVSGSGMYLSMASPRHVSRGPAWPSHLMGAFHANGCEY
eukprot:CAMPEP_0177267296 /NCGR_PEP_ID=MMETSP0367-20130122/63168_1 /TAXON_ID=447022 ORGANISM="Scrippsiella hangoei-like, Strain SHHI-4" /NCGR_SAMPLE_ID=MMETSP0367 /ASSEMBLY_ACC=CAM_ASM_000362 /LENGTH=141 /DNA_ID=CAMNT_0018722775 /DNA_START=118 /DNA_END=544 /DNA_ORIENTATION=-